MGEGIKRPRNAWHTEKNVGKKIKTTGTTNTNHGHQSALHTVCAIHTHAHGTHTWRRCALDRRHHGSSASKRADDVSQSSATNRDRRTMNRCAGVRVCALISMMVRSYVGILVPGLTFTCRSRPFGRRFAGNLTCVRRKRSQLFHFSAALTLREGSFSCRICPFYMYLLLLVCLLLALQMKWRWRKCEGDARENQ